MSSRNLTKVGSQAAPYGWVWTTRGTRSVASKYVGTTQFILEGVDDTALLAKVNAHDGYRVVDNLKAEHG